MNLTLGRRGDYALRAAICLAEAWSDGRSVKIREVSDSMELPLSYSPQILGLLVRSGVAQAKAGPDGGYRLARSPDRISVLEIVEAAEGELRPRTCILRGGSCRTDPTCSAHEVWSRASDAFIEELAATPLSVLVRTRKTGTAGRRTSRRADARSARGSA